MKLIILILLAVAIRLESANANFDFFTMTNSSHHTGWDYYNFCFSSNDPLNLQLAHLKQRADAKCTPQSARLYRIESFTFKCDDTLKDFKSDIVAHYHCQ